MHDVTVIVVATVSDEDLNVALVKPLEGPVLAAIESVERQDYPHDLIIIRNIEGYALEDMQRFGAEKAETEWVAFIREDQVWPDDWLGDVLSYTMLFRQEANLIIFRAGVLARREDYLS